MSLLNTLLWRRCLKGLSATSAKRVRPRSERRPNHRLAVEALEDRATPAALGLIDAYQFDGSSVRVNDVALDSSGNTYITGYFSSAMDADPSSGTYPLNGAGSSDAFVIKLDASGTVLYAVQLGGKSNDFGNAIAVDAAGNAYVVGDFSGTADFDPGSDTHNLNSAGGYDAFVVKLDPNGNFVYASQFGGTLDEHGSDIAVDGSGSASITGSFQGTAAFNPGGPPPLTSAGLADAFVVKLDSAGALAYADQFGGTLADVGNSIAVDSSGNAYITGYFQGTVDFDPGVGIANRTSAGGIDAFVVKLNSNNTLAYADRLGGTGNDYGNAIAIDADGNAYVVGSFFGTVDFNPGVTPPLTSAGSTDVFVVKLGTGGNVAYASRLGGTSSDTGSGIAVDGSGNAYITGYFRNTANFYPGVTPPLTSAGLIDAIVGKLDPDGTFVSAVQLGGALDDYGDSIAVDGAGNAYVVGTFSGTADFDPGTGTATLTSPGTSSGYLAKLGQSPLTVSVSASDPDATETTAPAPADPGAFTMTLSSPLHTTRSVAYTLSGTATNGIDYATISGSVTIPAGGISATITVSPINDSLTERPEPETVVLTLTPSDSYTLGTNSATVNILDNEPEVSIQAISDRAREVAAPNPLETITFDVYRSGSTASDLTVYYTVSGTATAGLDYPALSGSVVIPAGSNDAVVTVTPLNDAISEGNETVIFKLTPNAAYTLTTSNTASATILDNEPEVRLIAADSAAVEGTGDTGQFTVTRTGDTSADLVVHYAVSGSAANGSDYAALPGTVVIPAGASSADIVVTALADSQADNGETVVLSLENDPAYTIASPFSGQVTISEPPVTPVAPPAAAAPTLSWAIAGPGATVIAFNSDGTLRFVRNAGYAGYTGTVSVALGDLNNDGVLDVVTGTATGLGVLRAFDGATGADMGSLMPFGDFGGGINVAAGDIDGDHYADVLVGAASKASEVMAFSAHTGALLRAGTAFPGYTGGVTVALGDLDGDHLADIIVGSASGVGVVNVYSGASPVQIASFLAAPTSGVNVAAGDLDGDGLAEIVVGTTEGLAGVAVFSPAGGDLARFMPFGMFNGGAHVAVTDRDNNGDREITAGAGPGGMPLMAVYSFPELAMMAGALVFDPAYLGGIPVA